MIRIYGRADGAIVRVAQTDDPAEISAIVPDAVCSLIIDPSTNAALVADYQSDPTPYKLINSLLYKGGALVTVAGPGTDTTDATNQEITPGVITATIDALTMGINSWDGLTNAQKQTFVLNNFKKVMQILRGVLRVILWLYKRG